MNTGYKDVRKDAGFLGDPCGPAERGWGLSPGWEDKGLTSEWITGITGERNRTPASS